MAQSHVLSAQNCLLSCTNAIMLSKGSGYLLCDCHIDGYNKGEKGIEIKKSRVLRSTSSDITQGKVWRIFPRGLCICNEPWSQAGEEKEEEGESALVKGTNMALGGPKATIS